MTIPTTQVEGTYLIDPETEDLIWGDELQEGMVVLLEDAFLGRGRLGKDKADLERVRWCLVTKLRFEDAHGGSGRLSKFIGVYGDGSKASRVYNTSFAWYVKRDSMKGDQ
jgi:hypothetical protein